MYTCIYIHTFKMIYPHVESFHKKFNFVQFLKNFVLSKILFRLFMINRKKNANYPSIPLKLLMKVLNEFISFAFTYKKRHELNFRAINLLRIENC